jgi:hypothetical protein
MDTDEVEEDQDLVDPQLNPTVTAGIERMANLAYDTYWEGIIPISKAPWAEASAGEKSPWYGIALKLCPELDERRIAELEAERGAIKAKMIEECALKAKEQIDTIELTGAIATEWTLGNTVAAAIRALKPEEDK